MQFKVPSHCCPWLTGFFDRLRVPCRGKRKSPSILYTTSISLQFLTKNSAEPAVHVLTKQVEEITTGGVSKKAMLIALSIGVGISLGLSMIRIVFDFSILYYIIPGYFISLGLSFFVPLLFMLSVLSGTIGVIPL